MTTRRQFLVGCSALTVAAGLTPATLLAAPFQVRDIPLDRIGFDTFASQLDMTFRVSQKAAPDAGLKLVEAKPVVSSHPLAHLAEDARNEKFSLLFRGPAGLALGQDTHTFENKDIGRFAMFIVPVKTRDTGHAYYEATFNRPSSKTLI